MFKITSRAPQGARGLKCTVPGGGGHGDRGRAPQGARGLKYIIHGSVTSSHRSRPARGAWVEMCKIAVCALAGDRRAPQGARGLKCPPYSCGVGVRLVAPRKGRVG